MNKRYYRGPEIRWLSWSTGALCLTLAMVGCGSAELGDSAVADFDSSSGGDAATEFGRRSRSELGRNMQGAADAVAMGNEMSEAPEPRILAERADTIGLEDRLQAPIRPPGTIPAHEQGGSATDANNRPLVIYQAQVHLAVYEVNAKQEAIIARVEELGGRLARRTDQQLVVRVPAEQFNSALEHTEAQGDVLHRDVTAQDVGEEYRDLEIRIRNLVVMRQRLEVLLTRADDIQAALAIERELQRLTTEVERMRGRVRYLASQVSFSTITIHFQPKRDEVTTPDTFRLPFSWLNQLGLQRLMRL